ncbi:hypothetical protein H9P43_009171 [Blastocladiella emersonii ATCC 22665]|nr:hypothetical protein H9P43_009171 [Blastocladiella emersonii ATCC 22665]
MESVQQRQAAAEAAQAVSQVWALVLAQEWTPATFAPSNPDMPDELRRGAGVGDMIAHHRLLARSHALAARHPDVDRALKRWSALVNTLLNAKPDAARILGMLFVAQWVDQWPAVIDALYADRRLAWADALTDLVKSTANSDAVRKHALAVTVNLLRAAAKNPQVYTHVVAPALKVVIPALLPWVASPALAPAALAALTDIVVAFPAPSRYWAAKLRAAAESALLTHPTAAATLLARAVALGTADAKIAGDWLAVARATVGSLHAALDVLLIGIDEDWSSDSQPADLGLLWPQVRLEDPSWAAWTDARNRWDAAVKVLAALATHRPAAHATDASKSPLAAIPAALILAAAERVLAAPQVALGQDARLFQLSVAFLPALRASALADLVHGALVTPIAQADALASLTPHAPALASVLARAMHLPAALTLFADLVAVLPLDRALRLLTTSPTLAASLRAADPHATRAVHAIIAAAGSRIPTPVRVEWDSAMLHSALASTSHARRHAARTRATISALTASATLPSVVTTQGVGAYNVLPLVHGSVAKGSDAALDAVAHPRRVPDPRPVVVLAERAAPTGPAPVVVGMGLSFVDPAAQAREAIEKAAGGEESDDEEEAQAMVVDTAAADEPEAAAAPAQEPVPVAKPAPAPMPKLAAPAPVPVKLAPVPAPVVVASAAAAKSSASPTKPAPAAAAAMDVDGDSDEDDDLDAMDGVEIVDSGPDSDEDDE